jgi:hypothetical protein
MSREETVRERRDLLVAGALEQSERLGLPVAPRQPHPLVADPVGVPFELGQKSASDPVAAGRLVQEDPTDLADRGSKRLQTTAADRAIVEVRDDPDPAGGARSDASTR